MSLPPLHGVPTHGAPTDWSRVVRRLTLEAKAHVLPYRGRNPPSSIVASILKRGGRISDNLREAAKCSDPLVAADATACLSLVESALADLSGLLPKTEVQKHEAPATPPHRPVWSTPILHLFPLTAPPPMPPLVCALYGCLPGGCALVRDPPHPSTRSRTPAIPIFPSCP
jgi:hypothetical protein